MEQNLKEALTQYKKYTLDLIASLEIEDYDSLDGLLNMRQNALDAASEIDHTKEEFTSITKELEILVLQKKLTELMSEKRNNVRKELNSAIDSKRANKNYNRKAYSNSMFLSKQI